MQRKAVKTKTARGEFFHKSGPQQMPHYLEERWRLKEVSTEGDAVDGREAVLSYGCDVLG